MMEPDDFRACLISMGYDLVSAPHPPPISTLSYIWITCYVPPTLTSVISFSPHHTH